MFQLLMCLFGLRGATEIHYSIDEDESPNTSEEVKWPVFAEYSVIYNSFTETLREFYIWYD